MKLEDVINKQQVSYARRRIPNTDFAAGNSVIIIVQFCTACLRYHCSGMSSKEF
jgi:hypothetical protein